MSRMIGAPACSRSVRESAPLSTPATIPAPAQGLGLRVGPVAELRRGGQDPVAGLLRDARLAIERETHRGDRDAGLPGHVTDSGRLLRFALLTRHGLTRAGDALLPRQERRYVDERTS